MRRSVITRFDAQRSEPYNPDDHSILDRQGQLKAKVAVKRSGGELEAKWDFETRFIDMETKKSWGQIRLEATTTLVDNRIPAHEDPGSDPDVPDEIITLLEGAFADEVLLPASMIARSMRLPGLLISPVQFDGIAGGPQDEPKAAAKQE